VRLSSSPQFATAASSAVRIPEWGLLPWRSHNLASCSAARTDRRSWRRPCRAALTYRWPCPCAASHSNSPERQHTVAELVRCCRVRGRDQPALTDVTVHRRPRRFDRARHRRVGCSYNPEGAQQPNQAGGRAGQHRNVMPRIVNRLAAAVAAAMLGDDSAVLADADAVGIGLDS
jgi:hypothetical protein